MIASLALAAALVAQKAANPLTQAEAEAAVAAVLPEVVSIRGLAFKRPVPVKVVDDARARVHVLARFHKTTPEGKIRADQRAYELLGLIPPGTDVVTTLLDVLEEQAGGFYDPPTKSFYLLDDMPRAMTPGLTAHEMTHALEDQYYDIDGRLAAIEEDDDASFALSAVAEGSASLVMTATMAREVKDGALKSGDLTTLQESEAGQAKKLDAMPGVLRKQLLGPYILGALFLARGDAAAMAAAYPRAGVNAAWAALPRSSEQILHPEKYWDPARRDDPKPVRLPNPARVLGPGWKRAGSGILGELTLGGLCGAPSPGAQDQEAMVSADAWTNAAAAGWGGDRWELWTKGKSSVVLLETVWDTVEDAAEFEAALPRGQAGPTSRRAGATVAIVAGDAGIPAAALLDLMTGASE